MLVNVVSLLPQTICNNAALLMRIAPRHLYACLGRGIIVFIIVYKWL